MLSAPRRHLDSPAFGRVLCIFIQLGHISPYSWHLCVFFCALGAPVIWFTKSACHVGDTEDQEDPLEEERATHSGILVQKSSRTLELGGLQYIGLQREEKNWEAEPVIRLAPSEYSPLFLVKCATELNTATGILHVRGFQAPGCRISSVFLERLPTAGTPLQKKVFATLLPLLSSHECSWRGYLFEVGRLNRSQHSNSGRVRRQIQQIARQFS